MDLDTIIALTRDAADIADTITDAPRGSAEWLAHFRYALPTTASELLDALGVEPAYA